MDIEFNPGGAASLVEAVLAHLLANPDVDVVTPAEKTKTAESLTLGDVRAAVIPMLEGQHTRATITFDEGTGRFVLVVDDMAGGGGGDGAAPAAGQVIEVTTSRALTAEDPAPNVLRVTAAGAVTLTLPPNIGVTGAMVNAVQTGAGKPTFLPDTDAGMTFGKPASATNSAAERNSFVSILFLSPTLAILGGDLARA